VVGYQCKRASRCFKYTLSNGNLSFLQSNLNAVTAQNIFDSFAVDNLVAASGGGDGDSIEEIKTKLYGPI
jgi:hypothetical protein